MAHLIQTFGQKLRALRKDLGLTQPQCAKLFGDHLSVRTLQEWEQERSKPDALKGYLILEHLRTLKQRR